ncbi:hypothetical protein FQA39_LY14900 [Lamprigera yunnana]|nr:hypothetical protein FQA39_LY14900 [Lamprigera yunnana]
MSVLNQSGEEQVECPLCMEPLEVDDLNFYPCSCGYQICRFCWHRIRTDENGLCPACRKAYSENPADFTPLSKEQVAQLKAEKRQRDQQRKAKLSESRKHLANVRVVQKNLVFVVGLPLRLADAEILKRHEYFGKFGKIHKVVINQSTAYAGSQGPSASKYLGVMGTLFNVFLTGAYVTYMKSDDALRAIQNVNNITIDGRLIKSSLGTTKYCSHFMKNQPCPKPDCMYLHDFGDPKASFTKEQMHAGKHQEYERKLHDMLMAKMAIQTAQQQQQLQQQQQQQENKSVNKIKETVTTAPTKENWPQLNSDKDKIEKKPETICKDKTQKAKSKVKSATSECNSKKPEKSKDSSTNNNNKCEKQILNEDKIQNTARSKSETETDKMDKENNIPKIPIVDDNSSFFSQNTFQKIAPDVEEDSNLVSDTTEPQGQILNDSLPNINSSEDWEAAFGFSKHNNHMDELAKQRNNVKDTLETFGNGFNNLDMFGNLESYQNGFDTPNKLQENILEALSNKHSHFGNHNSPLFSKNERLNGLNGQLGINNQAINGVNGLNGLDQQMSKFFTDFYKNGQKDLFNGISNGFNTHSINNFSQPNSYLHNLADRQNFLLMQQRQIEEQLMSLNLKQQSYSQQLLHNGMHSNQFINGDILTQNGQNYGPLHNSLYQGSVNIGKNVNRSEDELDFDPFDETQKALAELMETEQSHKANGAGSFKSIYYFFFLKNFLGRISNQINGLVHSQNSNRYMPPPPPGFMQNNTHMNSFGSKILPYLNMGNSQHQLNNSTQNNWSGNYSQVQQQQQQHKGTCNDWKVLDPAIVSSSRHCLLSNMRPREHYNNMQSVAATAAQQLQNGPLRSYDYQNFSNYTPQIPANYNNFSHINNHQNLNWLGNELNSQISSPPGFRTNNQATKQQEC